MELSSSENHLSIVYFPASHVWWHRRVTLTSSTADLKRQMRQLAIDVFNGNKFPAPTVGSVSCTMCGRSTQVTKLSHDSSKKKRHGISQISATQTRIFNDLINEERGGLSCLSEDNGGIPDLTSQNEDFFQSEKTVQLSPGTAGLSNKCGFANKLINKCGSSPIWLCIINAHHLWVYGKITTGECQRSTFLPFGRFFFAFFTTRWCPSSLAKLVQ